MSLDTALRHLTRDPREWCLTGLVHKVEDSKDFGTLLTVELVDGRKVEARPAYLSGVWSPYSVGDEVLVLAPGGSVNAAVALATMPTSRPQKPESVHGVVLRTFLDDLSEHLDDLITIGQSAMATSSATPAGTVTGSADLITGTVTGASALNASTVATINTLRQLLIDLGSTASALRALVEQSRGDAEGLGGAPHCSPALRATDLG